MTYLFENDEHAALRSQVERFAAAEIAPHADAWEEAEGFPLSLYGRTAAAGVLGIGYPEAYGGSGGDLSHVVVASEAMVLAGRSVIASADTHSPRSTLGIHRCRCSSVPARRMGGSAMPWLPRPTVVPTDRPARIISSAATTTCVTSPPPPPADSG